MPQATQKNRFISIDTPLGEDVLLLHHFTGAETLSRPFTFNLELLSDQKHDIDLNQIVGQNVTIRMLLHEKGERYFNGYVSSFTQTAVGRVASDEIYSSYRATMVPWLWLLTRTADCRMFQAMTVPDIIMMVFGDYGFSGFVENKLTEPYRVWEYCVQYRETAFNFVSRLMEQEGIYYYFKHDNGKHMLVLCDSPGAHDPYPDYEEIPFRPTREKAQPKGYIWEWEIERSIQPGQFTHTDYNFKLPRTPLLEDPFAWPFSQIEREHQHADFEVFDYPGNFDLPPEGEQYAKARIQELQASHEIGTGSSDSRGIATGYKFKMTKHPREDQLRQYLVISSSYRATTAEYETGVAGGGEFACKFQVIPSDTSYRASRSTPKSVIQGAQTAVVVGPPGEEIYTDEFGRVKVQFHWDREHEYEEESSCWIRVAQSWASKKWGTIYIPRIGQEVIVEFLEGDPDRPIITGCVYNADMMPPYDLPGKKVISGVKTNSTIGGGGFNEFSLDDTKGVEMVKTHAQFDMETTVEHDKTTTVHNNRTATIDVDDTESVGSNQTISVGSNQKTSVGSNQETSVGANQTLSVGSNQDVSVGSNRNLTVGSNQTNAIGANEKTTVGSNQEIHVGAQQVISVGADQNVTVNANRTTNVNAADTLTVTGAETIDANGEITITSGAKIKLTAGGSTIEIGPAGITIQAAAKVTVTGAIINLN